ncbi:uncharacterized protein [Macrobrachium rosenbergii]|uniref:uncharacterized protein n=1 Tax=Macrobrachium rosenbergii TaxID=79674 RepID=UPI0034D6214A
MALAHSSLTFLLSLVISCRICEASNASFSMPSWKGDHSVPFAVGTPNKGRYPFGEPVVAEMRLLQSLNRVYESKDDFTASLPHESSRDVLNSANLDADLESSDSKGLDTKTDAVKTKTIASLERLRDKAVRSLEKRSGDLRKQFSSMNFPSLEAALLSLAFLTFAVFVIDLIQDLFRGTSTGRKRRSSEPDDGMTDVIVLALSSIDTLSYGSQNPACGQKLLCHLNRSGWHDGLLGSASNYFVSLLLSVFSPKSGFQKNLDAAHFGKESEDCTERYSGCPSVLGELLPK